MGDGALNDWLLSLSNIEWIVLAFVIIGAFVWFLRLFDKDNSIETKIENLENKLSQQEEELQYLLPKVEPLEKEELQSKYSSKKNREISYELSQLKGRIKTLERLIEQDSEKLLQLKDKK